MKKLILLFALLFATTMIGQEVFNTQVKMNQTPILTVPDSLLTKDNENTIRSTSIEDLGAVLSPIFSTEFVDLTTDQTVSGIKTINSLKLGGTLNANSKKISNLLGISFDGSGDIDGTSTRLRLEHNTRIDILASAGTANIIVSGTSITTGLTDLQIDNTGSISMVSAGWVQNEIANGGVTQTSQITNDGSDGTSTYVEADEILTHAKTDVVNTFTENQNIRNKALIIGELAGTGSNDQEMIIQDDPNNTEITNPRMYEFVAKGSQTSPLWNGGFRFKSYSYNNGTPVIETIIEMYKPASGNKVVNIFGDLTVSGTFSQSFVDLERTSEQIRTVGIFNGSSGYTQTKKVGAIITEKNSFTSTTGGPGWIARKEQWLNTGSQVETMVSRHELNDSGLSTQFFGTLKVTSSTTASDYRISALNTAPSSASDTGTLGEIRYDENYIYLCTATDTWKRSQLTTW
ncbi:MAG: hypothetical protein QQN55_01135 [Nitrosopumilus sp.]